MSGYPAPTGWQTPALSFADKYPGEALDYSLDLSDVVDPTTDIFASVAVVVAPSGAGELSITNVTAAGSEVTITVAGGQPCRRYWYKITATMTDGRIFERPVWQDVKPDLPTDRPQAIPSADYGPAATWPP
jgi:hypothetical protein